MSLCQCGGRLVRVRRRLWQRLVYSAVYRCTGCGQVAVKRPSSTVFSRQSLCPKCGTPKLRILRKPDAVDTMSSSPLSWIQKLLGAKLHHCEGCRLQFYDFRKVAERKPAQTEITP